MASHPIRTRHLLLTAACALAMARPAAAQLDAATNTSGTGPASSRQTQGSAIPPSVSRTATETILVKARRRLVKERNSPSAVTELGAKQIQQAGIAGSPQTLLRQAPSVYVYQQGIGDSAPELTIRGARGLETASTLDDVPTQDLLAPGASSIANNIGNIFTLEQISGVSIYPGIAYPDKNTFGTIGGTIAYQTKRPSNDFYIDLYGSVGSFQTYRSGFEINSGFVDSPLGTGDNAAKLLLNYSNLQTAGFIDYTGNRENEMEFAFDKPYDDGLSKVQATVLYNTGTGYVQNEPVPTPYLNRNGLFSNYPTDVSSAFEQNDYLTIIVKDDTYINDNFNAGVTAFYLKDDNNSTTYGALAATPAAGGYNPYSVNGAAPFINTPAGFDYGSYYGPGSANYQPGVYTYNPLALYPPGSKYCPASYYASYQAVGDVAPCGLNGNLAVSESDTYGIQPRLTYIAPEWFGIANTVKIGGLFAKETSPSTRSYYGPTPVVAQTAGNLDNEFGGGFDGGTQRTIYQGFVQDKIDFLDNTLHITPGVTLEATYSSFKQSYVYNNLANDGNGGYTGFKSKKYNREWLPFFNVAYDFDKIAPALAGMSVYGSTGQSALFAPVTDFGPNSAGPPPNASIVHLYEGGIKYNTPKLFLSVDYYYQKVDRDFGFYTAEAGPEIGQSFYDDSGEREFKGVEGAAQYQVTPDLQLFGNFSHELAKYLKNYFAYATVAEDQYGIALRGAPVTGIPDWLSTFGVDYGRKNVFRDDDSFDVRFSGTYTGHQFTTYDISGNANVPNFPGLAPNTGGPATPASCALTNAPLSCSRFAQISGATVYDPHGGLAPFAVFNLDMTYTLPTPYIPHVKNLKFNLNIQNLFDQHYYQYFYRQISPSACLATPSNPVASQYECSPQFADGIPGEPFSVFFTVTARF